MEDVLTTIARQFLPQMTREERSEALLSLKRLISTSKPRFLQEDADDLASHWGPVELEYHEDAFDEEYSEGGAYYVNTPEEDW